MSLQTKLEIVLSALDKVSTPFKNMSKQAQKMADTVSKSQKALKALQQTQAKKVHQFGLVGKVDKAGKICPAAVIRG